TTALDAEQLERDAGLLRAHREVVADRQAGDVRPVDAADQLHVAEHAGVADEIDGLSVLEADHDAARLPEVRPVGRARGVERVHERVTDPVDLLGAALVEAGYLADRCPLGPEPALQLDLGDDLRSVLLGERDRVADMVDVAVRDNDHVDVLGVALGLGARGVAVQERIDVDALALGAVKPKSCVSEPREGGVRHGAYRSRAGASDRGTKLALCRFASLPRCSRSRRSLSAPRVHDGSGSTCCWWPWWWPPSWAFSRSSRSLKGRSRVRR